MANRTVSLGEFLTESEMALALSLGKAKEIAQQIIKPNIERINKALGQQNDPMYLAYAVEYVIGQAKGGYRGVQANTVGRA